MQYVGVTERGDAGLDFSWINKLNKVEFAIIISKCLNDNLIEELINNKNRIIFHHTVTGYGSSILEPNVPSSDIALNQTKKLIANGFPENQIVLRVDPIVPTKLGIQKAINTINLFMSNTNIKRVRYSFIDLYPHVKERLIKANINLPFNSFSAPKYMMNEALTALEYYKEPDYDDDGQPYCSKRHEIQLESCAENTEDKIGCISNKDREILGLDIPLIVGGYQRKGCLCAGNKLELLSNKKRCSNDCLYCYWKDS